MIGIRIATQRMQFGMIQKELARRLCVSTSAVGMYEQGRREPSLEVIAALANELHVSTDYLLTGTTRTTEIHQVSAKIVIQCMKSPESVDAATVVLEIQNDTLTSDISMLLTQYLPHYRHPNTRLNEGE